MTYPYVPSANDYGPAAGPRRGLNWHMAEGGGTVGYLAKDNPNGVSVHFVIEYSGRVVQMLSLDHMNGSIRPTDIRTSDDAPFLWGGIPVTYGATAARAVLGSWATMANGYGPNHATIGVEIEGFAKDGPNPLQVAAMVRLYVDMANRFPGIRSLAHRDFADYKSCPGRLIPWDRVGGHGPEVSEMPLAVNAGARLLASDYCRDAKAGTVLYRDTSGARLTVLQADGPLDDFGLPVGSGSWAYVLVRSRAFDTDTETESGLALVKLSDVGPLRRKTSDELAATGARYVTPAPADCTSAVAEAITADRAKARIVWE